MVQITEIALKISIPVKSIFSESCGLTAIGVSLNEPHTGSTQWTIVRTSVTILSAYVMNTESPTLLVEYSTIIRTSVTFPSIYAKNTESPTLLVVDST